MTQHPPLYYAVDAGVLRAFGALDWRFDRTLALMRLVQRGDGPLAPAAGRRDGAPVHAATDALADLAAFLPLAVPQLAALGGSVTNDALVILLGGVLTYCLARVLTGDRSWRTVVLVGVTLGSGAAHEGHHARRGAGRRAGGRRGCAPRAWRCRGERCSAGSRSCGGSASESAAGGGRSTISATGPFQPDGVPQDGLAGLVVDRPRVSVWAFGDVFWDKITLTFWGDFGQLELPLAQPLVVALTVVLVLLALLAFRARGKRVPLVILLSFPVAVLLALFAGTYSAHLVYGRFGGIQGRYLYGGLVIVLVAVALGLGEIARLAGRAGGAVLPVVVALALAGAGYGMWFAFRGYYLDVDWTLAEGWERMVQWSPWPDSAVRSLAVGVVLLSLLAMVVAVRTALRPVDEEACREAQRARSCPSPRRLRRSDPQAGHPPDPGRRHPC